MNTPYCRHVTRLYILGLTLFPAVSNLAASERSTFYGEWGTEAQCSRELIIPEGTKHYSPFEIRDDWISHGEIWCRLNWSTTHSTTGVTTAQAFALCGEDDVRNYRIGLELSDNELFIRWDFWHRNGPLMRCFSE